MTSKWHSSAHLLPFDSVYRSSRRGFSHPCQNLLGDFIPVFWVECIWRVALLWKKSCISLALSSTSVSDSPLRFAGQSAELDRGVDWIIRRCKRKSGATSKGISDQSVLLFPCFCACPCSSSCHQKVGCRTCDLSTAMYVFQPLQRLLLPDHNPHLLYAILHALHTCPPGSFETAFP